LPPRDDAAEFDEGGVDLAGHEDDREAVLWRKSNKVRLFSSQMPVLKKGRKTVLSCFADLRMIIPDPPILMFIYPGSRIQ
jgi:hypothetical protein